MIRHLKEHMQRHTTIQKLVFLPRTLCNGTRDGRAKILKGILRAFGKGISAKDLEKPPRRPGGRASSIARWVRIGPFWLKGGPNDPVDAAELDLTTNQRR